MQLEIIKWLIRRERLKLKGGRGGMLMTYERPFVILVSVVLALSLICSITPANARTYSWTDEHYGARVKIAITTEESWTTNSSYSIAFAFTVENLTSSFLYDNSHVKLAKVDLDVGYVYDRSKSPFVNLTEGKTWEYSWEFTPTAKDFGLSEGESESVTLYLSISYYIVEVDGTENHASFYNSDVTVKVIAGPDAPKEKEGGCFIATAVYGSSEAGDLDDLRLFRNQVLMPTMFGKALVETYYLTSPPIADAIRQNEGLKIAVKTCLIIPVIYFVKIILSDFNLIILGICLLGTLLLMRKHKLMITLKALGFGALVMVLLMGLVFCLGWLAYTWKICATIAAYLLPTILPVSISVIALKLLRSKR